MSIYRRVSGILSARELVGPQRRRRRRRGYVWEIFVRFTMQVGTKSSLQLLTVTVRNF